MQKNTNSTNNCAYTHMYVCIHYEAAQYAKLFIHNLCKSCIYEYLYVCNMYVHMDLTHYAFAIASSVKIFFTV